MLSITPTKLADYLICPQKYKFRHLERRGATVNSAALTFGNSLHRALEAVHNDETALSKAPFDSAQIQQILNRCWDKSAYAGQLESDDYFKRGSNALLNYCRSYCNSLAATADKTLGTETYLSYVAQQNGLSIRFGCKVDRVAVAGDVLELIDYKTSASGKVPTTEFLQTDLPAFLYYILARLNYSQHPRIRVTFLNVLTLAKSSIEYAPEQVTANKTLLWQTVKQLAQSHLAAAPSEVCAWCDYRDECAAVNRTVDFADIL